MNNTNDIQEELVTKVMEALDSIRPFLNKDGGDIELVNVEDKTVYVRLLGHTAPAVVSVALQ